MANPIPQKTGYEKWQGGLDKAVGDANWDIYDCEIQSAVGDFNRHLATTPGYIPVDWQLIKAMLWTETGAVNREWKSKPMQIGVQGDPGLTSLLSGKEGGDQILPPNVKDRLSVGAARTVPGYNIRAGIGYLLMRMAIFDYRTVMDDDTQEYQAIVKAHDSLDRVAKTNGTTVQILRDMNPKASAIRAGDKLLYKKAAVKLVIVGWRAITTGQVAQRYNGGGDPNYAKKLDYVLNLVRQGKLATCPQ